METTTNPLDVLINVQLLDREIAELESALAVKRAERAALAEEVHEALDALQALAPRVNRGVHHRFTDDEVREFRRRYETGVPASVIAREAHVSGQAMRMIVNRKNYQDVE